MSIYILEDDLIQTNHLCQTLEALCEENKFFPGKITAFTRPKDILQASQTAESSPNLYFLDIKVRADETAGLATARKIRNLEPDALIAFVTTYADLALKSYEYMTAAFAYILKTASPEAFAQSLKTCLKKYTEVLNTQTAIDYFSYEDRYTNLRVPFHDLYYISTLPPHKILVKTITREICFHGTLKEVADNDPRLIRCHKSFYINGEKIQILDKSARELTLTDGTVIPVARKSVKEVQDALARLKG